MAHKCFISFKTEDMDYKKKIQEDMDIDMIDKSLDVVLCQDLVQVKMSFSSS